jgi:hypothetical protein
MTKPSKIKTIVESIILFDFGPIGFLEHHRFKNSENLPFSAANNVIDKFMREVQ